MSDEHKLSHEASQFSKLGRELLDRTERPNVITIDQFLPYVEIFSPNVKRLESDVEYREATTRLMNDYRTKLGINPFYPTVVVDQLVEPIKVVLFLDRWWSKIKPDNVIENSARENVPSNVVKVGGDHRDALILSASIKDLMEANTSEEQERLFQANRAESAMLLKIFVEHNLPQEKRDAMMALYNSNSVANDTTGESITSDKSDLFRLDDDE